MKYPNPLPLDLIQQASIDAWTDIYVKAHIADLLAIPLSKFLTAPIHYLDVAGQETAPNAIANGYRPLLPAQIVACRRIQMQWHAQGNAERSEQATAPRS